MLTRIRFEAEGATPEECRSDLYAAAERLLSAALARIYNEPESDADFSVRMSSWVHEEIYSALSWNERVPDAGQLYKGRLVIGLPVAPPEQTFTDAVFRYGHLSNTELAAAVEDTSPEECGHPHDAIFYNPDNGVFQCHRCGTIFDVIERGDGSAVALQPSKAADAVDPGKPSHGRKTR